MKNTSNKRKSKLDFIKMKNIWAKRCYQESEKTTHGMGRIFTNHIYDKRFVSRIYKKLTMQQ